MIKNKEKVQYTVVIITDAICILSSFLLSFFLFSARLHLVSYTLQAQINLTYIPLLFTFIVVFWGFMPSSDITKRSWKDELKSVIKMNFMYAAILATTIVITKNPLAESRRMYVGIIFFNILFMFFGHRILRKVLIKNYKNGNMGNIVGIVTTSDRADAFVNRLKNDWIKRVVGVVLLDKYSNESSEINKISDIEVRAYRDNFMEWARVEVLDEIFINVPYGMDDEYLMSCIKELESMGIVVHLNIMSVESFVNENKNYKYSLCIDGGYPMITIAMKKFDERHLLFKRIMDIIGSLIGCIISLPIIAVVAIPLLLESPGPLIFKQKRVGLNGRYFDIYKLRSMCKDAEKKKRELMALNEKEGQMFKIKDDPRITKVGKFIRKTSIDELPQFFNVLKGDMSLVGTRPPTLDEYTEYKSVHKRRLSMKPGITGIWQTSGRSDVGNFDDVVKMDLEYIDTWSIWLDIKLLFKTVWVVLRRSGAE